MVAAAGKCARLSCVARLRLSQSPSCVAFCRLDTLGSDRSHFGRHREGKTVHRTVFPSLTQRATLVGLITQNEKKQLPEGNCFLMVAAAGLEPAASGL